MQRLPRPAEIGLSVDSLTLVSFDPYMYSSISTKEREAAKLYRPDLGLLLYALGNVKGQVIIQLSTYGNTRVKNQQGKVIHSVNSVLTGGGFKNVAKVIANERMMSLIYAREVGWANSLADIPVQFEDWLARQEEN